MKLEEHDWTFRYSDDFLVVDQGESQWDVICDLAKSVGDVGWSIVLRYVKDKAPEWHPGYHLVHAPEKPKVKLPPRREWRTVANYREIREGDRVRLQDIVNGVHRWPDFRFVMKGDPIVGMAVADLHKEHPHVINVMRLWENRS